MKPHFFAVKSRIGLVQKPIHQSELNISVEDGADAILDTEFLQTIGAHTLTRFSFPLPETIPPDRFSHVLSLAIKEMRNRINAELQIDERQIVIGGDHSVTLSSVLALMDRAKSPERIGYIHFDSHGDMNLQKDSPTNNFHGMYLRPIINIFDIPEIDTLVPYRLLPENMLFIGNLDLDHQERIFFETCRLRNITRDKILSERDTVLSEFETFIRKYKYIHVSFDVDVFDRTFFEATGIPADHGLMLEDVLPFLQKLKECENLSFDLAEFNPQKKGAKASKKIAQQILTYTI